MKNLSMDFKRALATNHRNYLAYADVTWPRDQQNQVQTLALDNTHIWSGGFSYEELVSEDEEFTALGSVYMGTAKLILNNIDERYTPYVFEDAETFVLRIGMEFPDTSQQSGKRIDKYKIGTYHADDVKYDGTKVFISLQDNIAKLDKPYSTSNLTYPNTLFNIVNNCCTTCGIQLANSSLQFPHRDFVIQKRPTDDAITHRDIISWAATIAGCFVKCNPDGQLEFKWFDQQAIEQEMNILDGGTVSPWSTGEVVNGGTVSPWSTGEVVNGGTGEGNYSFHTITSLYSQNIALDDIVITGLTAQIDRDISSQSQDISTTFSVGVPGYIISITNNKFLNLDNTQQILNWLGNQLIGLRFRKLNISIPNNPSIESGDVALVYDRKGRGYVGLVTRVTFSIGGVQEIISGASTPTRNSATQYSAITRSIVEARRLAQANRTAFDIAIENLRTTINGKAGLYYTVEPVESGGSVYYLHDQQNLEDSSTVMMITGEAIAITDDYDGDDTDWNFGVTVDGTTITRILNAIGINASWINSGSLNISDTNGRETFYADTATGAVRIIADSFMLTSGETLQGVLSSAREYADKNLLKGSLDFSDMYWRVTGTLYGNQTDPKGGTNAFVLMYPSSGESGITAKDNNKPFPITGAKYRISIWLKASNQTKAASHPIGIYLNDTQVGTVSPTNRWKEYHFDTTITSVSQVGWVNIGGGNTFTSASEWNCYIYNPRVEIVTDTYLTKENIFNQITDNGANNGVFLLENGEMYISFTYAHGGTLKLGGNQNANGVLNVMNASGGIVASIDNTGTIFRTPSTGEYIKINENIIQGYATSYNHLQSWIDMCANYASSGGLPEYWMVFETSSYSEGIKLIAGSNGTISMDCGNSGIVDILSNVKISRNLTVDGTIYGTLGNNSDIRLKKNIQKIKNPIEKIKELNIYEFDWKDNGKHVGAGLIAQELQKVFPELIGINQNEYLTINYVGIIPYLIKTIQEQEKKIESLESRLTMLEKKLEKLI